MSTSGRNGARCGARWGRGPRVVRTGLLLASLLAMGGCDVLTAPDPTPDRFEQVAAGGRHTCAISDRGQVYCWGARSYQQLGPVADGSCSRESCLRPSALLEVTGATEVVAATAHTCVLAAGGASCWGVNRTGELGHGGGVTTPCPLIPYLQCSQGPLSVRLGFRLADLSASRSHTCALTDEGRAYCWGNNGSGRLGTGTTADRTVPAPVELGARLADIAAGDSHTCAISDDGEGWCWGSNVSGQLGIGAAPSSKTPVRVAGGHVFSRVAAGGQHTCAIDAAGAVLCWGKGYNGRLGTGELVDHTTPTPALLTEPAVDIDAGWAHSCAVTVSGAVYCWGWNAFGQTAQPGGGMVLEPARVPLDAAAARISTGEGHTCAVTVEGGLYCWGANFSGQIGNGSDRNSSVPVHIGGPAA